MTALPLLSQSLLALAAFACLCLATPRHLHRVHFATHPRRRRPLLRWASILSLAGAWSIAVSHRGWGPGLVELLGTLTLAAFVVIGMATVRPSWLRWVAVTGLLTGGVGLTVIYAT